MYSLFNISDDVPERWVVMEGQIGIHVERRSGFGGVGLESCSFPLHWSSFLGDQFYGTSAEVCAPALPKVKVAASSIF